MWTSTRFKVLGTLIVAGALALASMPAYAAPGGMAYTCNGGDIPSGNYGNVVVAGMCSVPDGATVGISGNLTVAAGAMLDAQSAPSTITVRGNVTAGPGSMLGLGCQPASYTHNSGHECVVDPEGHSIIAVSGNVTVNSGMIVLLNGLLIRGNVTLTGGGSPEVPWSVKNNTINGNLTMRGQTTNWIGVLFNSIRGNVTLTDITITDTDPGANGMYVGRNTVGGNLTCLAISPRVSPGFAPGSTNTVAGRAIGQCSPPGPAA